MRIAIYLTTHSARIDPHAAITLAWELLAALAELLGMSKQLSSREIIPTITSTSVSMVGDADQSRGLFASMDAEFDDLHRAAALLGAAEELLKGTLCDRMIRANARLPIPVIYDPDIRELLTYDETNDVIRCREADWAEVIATHLKIVKALSGISANDLVADLKVDGTAIALPDVSPTLFGHGLGAGRPVTSTCRVSGQFLVSSAVEVRIESFRNDQVLRANLGESARIAAMSRHPPFTAAIQYSEVAPQLPLLPKVKGTVTVEKLWDIEEQLGLDLK